ncbi:MAG TPA: zf-HC2 domain-containing protein [Blastocatellia bacterium]|nr:zf-HC2 domain-containing protein [Blastocatellia bacterium]
MKGNMEECGMHEALMSYLYGEATKDEAARVEKHLNACASCKAELEGFERVRDMLQQWQVDDLPIVRVSVDGPQRSFFSVVKELFAVAPLWAKVTAVAALALLVLAVTGTEVRVGSGGVSLRADLLRRQRPALQTVSVSDTANLEQVRAEVKGLVNTLIAESEKQEKEELQRQLQALEAQLTTARSTELARLASRIQEHQVKIQTIERDIDRREGADLTDILFGELAKPTANSSVAAGGN